MKALHILALTGLATVLPVCNANPLLPINAAQAVQTSPHTQASTRLVAHHGVYSGST
jgi:hypothetical protein